MVNVIRSSIRFLWRLVRPIKRKLLVDEYRMLEYALNEVSELRSLIRYLLAESEEYQKYIKQTSASFDYQWAYIPSGTALISDAKFRAEATAIVERYTSLPREWFADKKVLDAGCGNGRFSWALCQLGARVTAIDQSLSGIDAARLACANFPSFQARQHDVLKDIGMPAAFDLVWSFGVVHHTGNTYLAVQNLAKCVKPGGHLYLMIYSEPRFDYSAEFAVLNRYTLMRRKLMAMEFDERVRYLQGIQAQDEVHGLFDTYSPMINDLYRFDEIAEWLRSCGFSEIRNTAPPFAAGHHVIARKLM